MILEIAWFALLLSNMLLLASCLFRRTPSQIHTISHTMKSVRCSSSCNDQSVYKLPRIYYPNKVSLGISSPIVEADVVHYLLNVMRLKDNAEVRIFNHCDGEFVAQLVAEPPFRSKRRYLQDLYFLPLHHLRQPISNESIPISVTLFLPIIKKDRLKLMVEKLTELGVHRFVPLITQNTNADFIEEKKVWESLQKILIQASEQCERLDIPKLYKPVSIPSLLKNHSNVTNDSPLHLATFKNNIDHFIICQERSLTVPTLLQCLSNLRSDLVKLSKPHIHLGIVVGPEGGFAPKELLDMSYLANPHFVSLGSNVLRSETATIVASSIVSAVLQDLKC